MRDFFIHKIRLSRVGASVTFNIPVADLFEMFPYAKAETLKKKKSQFTINLPWTFKPERVIELTRQAILKYPNDFRFVDNPEMEVAFNFSFVRLNGLLKRQVPGKVTSTVTNTRHFVREVTISSCTPRYPKESC